MVMRFSSERKYFATLKSELSPAVTQEFISAMGALLSQYNTTIYENRFIAGGATEVFVVALLRSARINARTYGEETEAGDIILPGRKLLSVKGSFSRGNFSNGGSIRLINKLGAGKRNLNTATLFVLSGVGIIYADPEMLSEEDFRDSGDALEIRTRALKRVAEDPQFLIEMDIPFKPPTEQTLSSRKASTDVAMGILTDLGLHRLKNSADVN